MCDEDTGPLRGDLCCQFTIFGQLDLAFIEHIRPVGMGQVGQGDCLLVDTAVDEDKGSFSLVHPLKRIQFLVIIRQQGCVVAPL